MNYKLCTVLCVCLLFGTGCARVNNQTNTDTDPAEEISSKTETSGSQQSSSDAAGAIITDDLGRNVSVEKADKVAALIGSFADLWIAAGGQDTLAGAAHDAWTSFELDLENVTDLGDVKNISSEALIALNPDLVLASAKNESQKELASLLEQAQIPVLYYDVSSFADYVRLLNVLTDLTGRKDLYKTNGTDLQKQIEEIIEMAQQQPAKTAVYIRTTKNSVKTVSWDNSVLGQMLLDFGAVNALQTEGEGEFSMEALLEADPDQIYLVYQGSDADAVMENAKTAFLDQPVWQQLKAVQNGQVFVMDSSLFNLKPNASWAQAYEILYETMFENGS